MSAGIGRARIIMLVGAILLAAAASVTLWDLSDGDDTGDPVKITGDIESP